MSHFSVCANVNGQPLTLCGVVEEVDSEILRQSDAVYISIGMIYLSESLETTSRTCDGVGEFVFSGFPFLDNSRWQASQFFAEPLGLNYFRDM